jgi:DNA mismatch repair protein MutS2
MKTVDRELFLRRLTVEEALDRLDQYLYDAFMAGLSSVRIVHGKGTGKLRRAVHESLAKHPLVKSYRLGDYGEGDYGVTVVELTNH